MSPVLPRVFVELIDNWPKFTTELMEVNEYKIHTGAGKTVSIVFSIILPQTE